MNMREFQNLSIDCRSRQPSRHESNQQPLPGMDYMASIAGRGQVPDVSRPRDYPGPSPIQPGYINAQPHQAQNVAYYGYPHASTEASTPPAAYSSPRSMYTGHGSDTSSDSSGSRESSAYPVRSAQPTATANARSTRSTRTKRGSESQGSGSDRSMKRPDSSKGELYCEECECPIDHCSEPRVHKARVKKIVKEKSSRSTQASILQGHEDLTQNALNLGGFKIQQPGNKKKSGMEYDKKEILVSTQIQLDEAMQTIASMGQATWDGYTSRASLRVATHIADGSPTELPAGSLMSGPEGEGPCLHEINNVKCPTALECRKRRRVVQFKNNLANS